MDTGCRIDPAVFIKTRRIGHLPYSIDKILINKGIRLRKVPLPIAARYFKNLSFTASASVIGCRAPFCIGRNKQLHETVIKAELIPQKGTSFGTLHRKITGSGIIPDAGQNAFLKPRKVEICPLHPAAGQIAEPEITAADIAVSKVATG